MTGFTAIRGQAMQVENRTDQPGATDVWEGRTYFDTSTGRLYCYANSIWSYAQFTTTSTSTTSTSTSTTSTSTTSTSTTSISTSTTSTSTTSTSSSTTLY